MWTTKMGRVVAQIRGEEAASISTGGRRLRPCTLADGGGLTPRVVEEEVAVVEEEVGGVSGTRVLWHKAARA